MHRCLKSTIHQIGKKNEWLLLSASFMAKFGLVFVLILEIDELLESSSYIQQKEHRFF